MNDHNVSPLTVQLMIACYVSPDPAAEVGASWGSPAGKEEQRWLLDTGLVTYTQDAKPALLMATEKGEAWLKRMLATPLPTRRAWVFDDEVMP